MWPNDVSVYETALTHSSFVERHPDTNHNEKLEFLGDSVLDTVVADYLLKNYPKLREGELTQIRSRIVNRTQLNKLALSLGLTAVIKASKVDINSTSIPGNTLEALLGAAYLDLGYEKTKGFIENEILAKRLDLTKLVQLDDNYKSLILEWAQKNQHTIKFDHKQILIEKDIVFEVHLLVDGVLENKAQGRTKKAAEQAASKEYFKGVHLD